MSREKEARKRWCNVYEIELELLKREPYMRWRPNIKNNERKKNLHARVLGMVNAWLKIKGRQIRLRY
jgi:hypothetical protein